MFAGPGLRCGVGGRADVRSQATETRSLRVDIRPAHPVTVLLAGRRPHPRLRWSAPPRSRWASCGRHEVTGRTTSEPTAPDVRQRDKPAADLDLAGLDLSIRNGHSDDTVTVVAGGEPTARS